MGPFYCPRDQRVYLDTSFFDNLQNKFGACSNSKACQFSEAYVIAHEVGHHVQNELGVLPRVTQAQQAASSQTDANALQVRVELQADCLAGVWANRAQQKHKFLDPSDVDQALQTASAMIAYRKRCKAMWCLTLSPMAVPRNANAGSRPASPTARSRAVTPLARRNFEH